MTKERCKCARVVYRNNLDGSRDYMIQGEARCPICYGSGFCGECSVCAGAGIFNSLACIGCRGFGKVRMENSGRVISKKIADKSSRVATPYIDDGDAYYGEF